MNELTRLQPPATGSAAAPSHPFSRGARPRRESPRIVAHSCQVAVLGAALLASAGLRAEVPAPAFVYETDRELVSAGDFDGDGRADVVIVDKESGKTRIGYLLSGGVYNWANWRTAGTKFVSGMAVGKLVDTNRDGLAFASADGNRVTVMDAASPRMPSTPVVVPVPNLGPNTIVAIAIGGPGRTPLQDLVLASIYNADPTPNLESLLRNDGAKFPKFAESPLAGASAHANRVALKAGQPEFLAELLSGDAGDTFRLADFRSGKAVVVGTVSGLPAGSDYVVGRFGGSALSQFVFYKSGGNSIVVRPVEQTGADNFALGAAKTFDLPGACKQLVVIPADKDCRLVEVMADGAKASILNFDGQSAPTVAQVLSAPTNEVIFSVAVSPTGVVLLTALPTARASARYQAYNFDGKQFAPGIFGGLASLADTDDMTVPDIQKRIVANLKEKSEADMKSYTNTIPGTVVSFEMVPIPGGEFLMGSPDTQKGRNADEGPQHRVKVSPFWMGKYEVTWNEYELFMFPDDEKRLREQYPTAEDVNKISDAVTRPSKPYVEMSFGMGKDRYPAIAMTQHGANKFCQWLSAKTGQFYRLPTEAEWEYACRAGTTTAYSFGDDASKLGEYAWYFENSDSKYQRIGKKKPNPWGLYDIHGNVQEWCLDQYDPDFYKQCAAKGVVEDPWNRATKPYPHCVRGGDWDDDAPALRTAARRGSDRTWKMTDPQLPKSIWYLSDSRVVGFRLVRPLKVPPPEEMVKYWTSGVERD